MNFSPSPDEFLQLSQDFDVISVHAKFTTDSETPLSAYFKLSEYKSSFLFESVGGGEQVSRYSFVGCNPKEIISCGHNETTIFKRESGVSTIPTPPDPLKLVEENFTDLKYHSPDLPQRFSGGAVGYLSYEYANRVENSIQFPKRMISVFRFFFHDCR